MHTGGSLQNKSIIVIGGLGSGGGSGEPGYTFGVASTSQILAIVGANDGDTVWNSDPDKRSPYTYFQGDWYSVGGGVLTL